jgi:hypothetical protein
LDQTYWCDKAWLQRSSSLGVHHVRFDHHVMDALNCGPLVVSTSSLVRDRVDQNLDERDALDVRYGHREEDVPDDHCDPMTLQQDVLRVLGDRCDHHEQDAPGDRCVPMNESLDALRVPDDQLHELGDHCVVGARNRELDVHYYGIQLLALAYLSLRNHHDHRCHCCPYKDHVHALDNLDGLGCALDVHRDCGCLAYVKIRASLVRPESEYLMALVRQ